MKDTIPFDQRYVLCADIGGSHITTAVCDLNNYSVIRSTLVRAELNSKSNAKLILNIWRDALRRSMMSFHIPVGNLAFAMPGPFDYEKGISYIKGLAKYESLFGLDIKAYLNHEFEIPANNIRFRNDAEATITGEVFAGAGRGVQNLIGITLGTGFGSALFKEEKVSDLNWGSLPFKDSIADDYHSTRWFLKNYFERTGLSILGVKELALLANDNTSARRLFNEFAQNLGDFLIERIDQSGAECLLICGNIAKAHKLFLPQLNRRLNIEIRLAELGEEAAMIGAAALFKKEAESPLV